MASHIITPFDTDVSYVASAISFVVFLSPLPTFYDIYKKKSTEGYQSIPYVVALISAMLTLYYAILKGHMPGVIFINGFGIFIETIYICFYLVYAPKKPKVQTMIYVLIVMGSFGAILLGVQLLLKGSSSRAKIVGHICVVFSVCTFAAPLCILRKVIKTKSVEYMPFLLTAFLTLSAVMWFAFGFLIKDPVIYAPNILGFSFGVIQMVLYMIYRKKDENVIKEQKLPELLQNRVIILDDEKKLPHLTEEQIIDIWKLGTLLYSEKLNARTAVEVEMNKPKMQTVET